ncbi:MAG: hypothetical protein O7B99_08515 [Planctomycetota bacterium]|nr:hypothetical protein [Planctomycetota bacterium]
MKIRVRLSRVLLALALVGPAAGFSAAQEEGERPALPEGLLQQQSIQDEMTQLFLRVERNLKRIDLKLNDAGAGEASLAEVEDSGLDQLLRDTQADGRQVVSDIDRILQLVVQSGSSSASGAMGQGQPEESPLDRQRDQGPRDREKTPDRPDQPNQDEPRQGEEPDSPFGSDDPGVNREGSPHDPESGDPVPVDQDADPWGMLPTRTRDVFRNEGNDDLPVQYRDWIDAYYRRLNQRR